MVFFHYLMPLDILQRMGKSPLLHLSPLALDQMLRLRLVRSQLGEISTCMDWKAYMQDIQYLLLRRHHGLRVLPTTMILDSNQCHFQLSAQKLSRTQTFRRQLARQVPFISLPSDLTTEALSKKRPFLYRAIIVVASYHDSVRQIELGGEFVRHLTEHLIFLGERNLDILQALLVYISWSVTYSALM
jgi:hypothetical protein